MEYLEYYYHLKKINHVWNVTCEKSFKRSSFKLAKDYCFEQALHLPRGTRGYVDEVEITITPIHEEVRK